MWKEYKSVKLTHFFVRLFYVLLLVVVIGGIFVFLGKGPSFGLPAQVVKNFYLCFYISSPAALIAIICLDKLMSNIRHDVVFDLKNVSILMKLSWCCFYVAAICAVALAVYHYITLVVIGVAALFIGLIIRVIRHAFVAAAKMREENEMTI